MINSSRFGLSQTIIDQIIAVAKRYPDIAAVKIYGSRANGTYTNHSDIDLAIYSAHFSAKSVANSNGAKTAAFELSQLPLAFKVDVVIMDELTNKALRDKINAQGITIWGNTFP